MENDTLFLTARPSFIEGIGRILDFGGTLTEFNRALSPEQADNIAHARDWAMVGQDMMAAIKEKRAEVAEMIK